MYQCIYLDPETGLLQEFTEETLVRYIRLAQRLDGVTGIHLQNLPLAAARRLQAELLSSTCITRPPLRQLQASCSAPPRNPLFFLSFVGDTMCSDARLATDQNLVEGAAPGGGGAATRCRRELRIPRRFSSASCLARGTGAR